jgi:hypothetical protein
MNWHLTFKYSLTLLALFLRLFGAFKRAEGKLTLTSMSYFCYGHRRWQIAGSKTAFLRGFCRKRRHGWISVNTNDGKRISSVLVCWLIVKQTFSGLDQCSPHFCDSGTVSSTKHFGETLQYKNYMTQNLKVCVRYNPTKRHTTEITFSILFHSL